MYCIHSSKSFCVAYFHHSTVLSKLHVFFFLRIQTVNGQQKMARLRWRWIRQVSRHYVSLILWYNVRLALIVLKKAMHVTLIKISITLIKFLHHFHFWSFNVWKIFFVDNKKIFSANYMIWLNRVSS